MKLLNEGDKAPDFTLEDQHGSEHRLSKQEGWVLLYFYPKDDTPGCTKEACGIRDNWAAFEELGVQVFGVSTDPVSSHLKFAEKYELPFTLLADEAREVVELYGVWGLKKFMGREYMGTNRVSYLINPDGEIAKVYEKVKAAGHAAEVLEDLKTLM